MTSALGLCPNCGLEIPADAPEGGCPGCVLEAAIGGAGDLSTVSLAKGRIWRVERLRIVRRGRPRRSRRSLSRPAEKA